MSLSSIVIPDADKLLIAPYIRAESCRLLSTHDLHIETVITSEGDTHYGDYLNDHYDKNSL